MARSRSAALVVLLALVVVIGVGIAARMLLAGDGGAVADATAFGSHPHRAVATNGKSAGVDSGNSPPAGPSAQRVEVPAAANATPSFASLEFKPGPAKGFPVHVVDARNHQPLAGAHVAVVSAAAVVAATGVVTIAEMSELMHGLRFETVARAIDSDTRGYLADAQGVARVDWPVGPAWIIGAAADRRGARSLERIEDGDFELPLAPRRYVEVEVVDAHGVPLVGARVEWARRDGDQIVQSGQVSVPVDARGVAQLERFEWLDHEGSGVLGVAVPWAGRRGDSPAVFVPCVEAKKGAAAEEEMPERLRCVVPGEFGAIVVRVVDAFGRRVDEKAYLTFFTAMKPPPADQEGDQARRNRAYIGPTDAATITGGSDTFAPVPLGLDLRLQVHVGHGAWATADLRGPKKHGETVRADLAIQSARCLIHGHLVGATKPTAVVASLLLSPRRPWLASSAPHDSSRPAEPPIALRISEDGAFKFDANVDSIKFGETLALLGFDGASGDAFEATVQLPNEIQSSDVDLGEVRVHAVAVVAAGRVLSSSRKPLAGVAVQLIDWSEKVPTDESGRFLFIGELTDARVVVHVDAPAGHSDATLAVEVGRRDLEIVLDRDGEIAGTLVADHEVSLFARPHGDGPGTQEVSPGVWFGGGQRTRSQLRQNFPSGKGSCPFSLLLPPGRYDVLATLSNSTPETLARVDDVEVVSGQTTRDPRLDPLIVRGWEVGKWRFTLARSDGAPPPTTWVRIAAADHEDEFLQTLYLGIDGASCDSALESAWIEVARPGFRHLRELHERGDVKLVLEPVDSHPFVVHVTVPQTSHDGEISWRVRAEPSWTPPVDDLDWFSASLGADGTARLELDEGEHWQVHVVAVKEVANRERRCEVRRLTRKLRDEDLERGTLDLRLEPEDVETATTDLALRH